MVRLVLDVAGALVLVVMGWCTSAKGSPLLKVDKLTFCLSLFQLPLSEPCVPSYTQALCLDPSLAPISLDPVSPEAFRNCLS